MIKKNFMVVLLLVTFNIFASDCPKSPQSLSNHFLALKGQYSELNAALYQGIETARLLNLSETFQKNSQVPEDAKRFLGERDDIERHIEFIVEGLSQLDFTEDINLAAQGLTAFQKQLIRLKEEVADFQRRIESAKTKLDHVSPK